MKQTIKITESQLRKLIKEELSEIAGYGETMQNAGNAFGNSMMGRLRRTFQPGKYQQYQRVQQQGNQRGQQAADAINAETENVPLRFDGVHDYIAPDWKEYIKANGGTPTNEPLDWSQKGFPTTKDEKTGRSIYQQKIAKNQGVVNKYGTGGRKMLPLGGADWEDGMMDRYNAQQQARQQAQQQGNTVNESQLKNIIKESIKKILQEKL